MSTKKGATTLAPGRSIERFDGQDYAIWAIHMKNILRERKLLKYINTRTDISNYDEDEDAQALAEIQFTLANSQMRHTIHCETTHDAWEKLKAKHQQSSKSNRIFLKNQFLSLRMKTDETINDFVSRVDNLADQLTALSVEKVDDEDKSLVLTRGVHESYSNVVIAMQESDKLDNYEHVVTSLTNEETRRKENDIDEVNEKAFYSSSRGNRDQNNKDESNKPRFEGTCHYCGKRGHKKFECYKKKRDDNNNRNSDQSNQANLTQQNEQSEMSNVQAFSAHTSTSSSKEEWIMDSGASHHMTSNRALLINYESFKTPTPIELGNNAVIYAQGRGSVTLNLNVDNKQMKGIFTNVLYVPDICKNLFSISQAISKDLTLHIQQSQATFFNKGQAVLTATKHGNLYHVDGSSIYPNTANLAANVQGMIHKHPHLDNKIPKQAAKVYALSAILVKSCAHTQHSRTYQVKRNQAQVQSDFKGKQNRHDQSSTLHSHSRTAKTNKRRPSALCRTFANQEISTKEAKPHTIQNQRASVNKRSNQRSRHISR
jgi:hypothetical protein